jgi:hypothetical protein
VFPVVVPAQPSDDAPLERLPTSAEAGGHYPVIDGAISTTPFVRATFARACLVAGTAVVAERSVKAPNGARISVQSVCRVATLPSTPFEAPRSPRPPR